MRNASATIPMKAQRNDDGRPFNIRALVAFFVLSYALSWTWVIPLAATGHKVLQGQGRPTHFPSLLGPMLAAFTVTAWTMKRRGVRDLDGTAVVVDEIKHPDELRRGIAVYRHRFPRRSEPGNGLVVSPISGDGFG